MTVAVAERPTRTAEPQKQPAETSYQYPGIPTTCDGAEAVVHAEVRISQAAGAYPITSSTTMTARSCVIATRMTISFSPVFCRSRWWERSFPGQLSNPPIRLY